LLYGDALVAAPVRWRHDGRRAGDARQAL